MALLHELTLRLMIVLFISGHVDSDDVDCLAGSFAVKSKLRQAADRTPPGASSAHLIPCAIPISFALSEKFGIVSKKNGNALGAVHAYNEPIAARSFGKAKFRGELAQPV
jgi:hypothetical protein